MNRKVQLSRHPKNMMTLGLSYLLSWLTGAPRVWGTPLVAMIEPINRCNLKCPLCHVGSGKLRREPRNLTLEEFEIILNKLPNTVRVLQLWNQGEPFMNPRFLDMVRLAHNRGFHTITSTNAHFLHQNGTAESVIASGLGELVVSLDGVTPDTYESVRQGGDLSIVLKSMQQLASAKTKSGSDTPLISAQCLLLKQVEPHLNQVQNIAKESGADRVIWKTVQVASLEEANRVLPENQKLWRYKIKGNELVTRRHWEGCVRTWFSTVILCDGSVVPCCFDKDGDYVMGNLLNQSFLEIWRGDRYREFRWQTLRRRAYPICNNCTEGLSKLYKKVPQHLPT